jgi:hypothetical protein
MNSFYYYYIGNLHTVNLEEGQTLFYESSKCLHGRMKTFKGRYYGSIFLHYQPVDKDIWNYSIDDVIAAVPPHWRTGMTDDHGKIYYICIYFFSIIILIIIIISFFFLLLFLLFIYYR